MSGDNFFSHLKSEEIASVCVSAQAMMRSKYRLQTALAQRVFEEWQADLRSSFSPDLEPLVQEKLRDLDRLRRRDQECLRQLVAECSDLCAENILLLHRSQSSPSRALSPTVALLFQLAFLVVGFSLGGIFWAWFS